MVVKALGRFEFDHVALGAHDTEAGARWLAEKTGASVMKFEPEAGQWYWSNALPLPHGALLEVIGPNPAHRGFHPIKELLKRYETPTPFFWHLGTTDFAKFCAVAKSAGARVERVERIEQDTRYGRLAYTRGVVGPGFRSTRPCVIHWECRPDYPELKTRPQCQVVDFALASPRAAELNCLLAELGLGLRASDGLERLSIRLKTPRGELALAGAGVVFEGFDALRQLVTLRLRSVFT